MNARCSFRNSLPLPLSFFSFTRAHRVPRRASRSSDHSLHLIHLHAGCSSAHHRPTPRTQSPTRLLRARGTHVTQTRVHSFPRAARATVRRRLFLVLPALRHPRALRSVPCTLCPVHTVSSPACPADCSQYQCVGTSVLRNRLTPVVHVGPH